MANHRVGALKRQREAAKRERRQKKEERRLQKKDDPTSEGSEFAEAVSEVSIEHEGVAPSAQGE